MAETMRLVTLIVVAIALALESGAMRGEDIQVRNWPDDVPCDAIRKNPDGSYTQLKDLRVGGMRMSQNTFGKDTPEVRVWDKKCIGKGV